MASHDFKSVCREFQIRANKIISLCDNDLVVLTKYFVAILSSCDNVHNQHFGENVLIFLTFVAYEIEALSFGKLAFIAQEKNYKGYISKQVGSFDPKIASKKESTVRLTVCCLDNLNILADDDDQLTQFEQLGTLLHACNKKLQDLADLIVTSLVRKNRGKGIKFTLEARMYTGFRYTSEGPLDTDARGRKTPRVSDGVSLLRNALDVEKRDILAEISSRKITPLLEYPHAEIVATVDNQIADEVEQSKAAQLAFQRRNAENEIIAQQRDDEKKRKRAEKLKAEQASRAISEQSSELSNEESVKKAPKTKSSSSLSRRAKSSREVDDDDEEGGFTLKGYRGDENDDHILERDGRKKAKPIGDLDVMRDGGYDETDDHIIKNLRAGGVAALRNFVLRGGNVSVTESSGAHGGVQVRSAPLSDVDEEWNGASQDKAPFKSNLDDLDFDECESSPESSKYLHSNFIDKESSSSEESRSPGSKRRASAKTKQQKVKKTADLSKPKRGLSKARRSKSGKGKDSKSSSDEDTSSSESDSSPRRRKGKTVVVPSTVTTNSSLSTNEQPEDKTRKREIVGLTEDQVVQFVNMNLVPFQLSAVQHQSVRSEQFEVDGQLMSDDEIATYIMTQADGISKKMDGKFLSFIKQHIMVEVFKDVHFIANVIQFYRAKRLLHQIPTGEHIACIWQEVLKEVAADSVNELVTSNQKILAKMEQNLLELKELRRQQRHEENQVIDDETEKLQNAQDYQDLKEYKHQMKLSKTALEQIEKVMKRRINCIAHSTGAKIICIWAKLNNFQHLLSGPMSKFEKKFIIDGSPYYSVFGH